jgi:hypothetical protein
MLTAVRGCTLSAEIFFQRESSNILFVSEGLLLFLYGVFGWV